MKVEAVFWCVFFIYFSYVESKNLKDWHKFLSKELLKRDKTVPRTISRAHGQIEKRGAVQVDAQAITDYHNKLRAGEGGSDMKKLVWDDSLAATAESCASSCRFEHCDTEFGENIYAWSAFTDDYGAMIQSWFDEKKDYDYNSDSCSAVCGHYTQVVWASAERVGCGMYECPAFDSGMGTWEGAVFFVCNYDPAGNMYGEKPFQVGEACSACEGSCDNGLCA